MSCDLTSGKLKVCKDGVSGVSYLYLFNFLEDPFTVTDGVATAMNVSLTEAFPYELEGDGNSLVEDKPSDRNTGTSINTQTITAILKRQDAETSHQMNLLTAGFPMAVVKDRNGIYHAVGIDDGIDFQVAPTTGDAKASLNGYTLTGVSTTGKLAPKLDEATTTAFLAIVVPPV